MAGPSRFGRLAWTECRRALVAALTNDSPEVVKFHVGMLCCRSAGRSACGIDVALLWHLRHEHDSAQCWLRDILRSTAVAMVQTSSLSNETVSASTNFEVIGRRGAFPPDGLKTYVGDGGCPMEAWPRKGNSEPASASRSSVSLIHF